jgi:hypothetical protein
LVGVIKSRRMKWVEHAACMEEMRRVLKLWLEILKEAYRLGNTGVD